MFKRYSNAVLLGGSKSGQRKLAIALACFGIGTGANLANASPVVDGINEAALPARSTDAVSYYYPRVDTGWYYTPSITYNLDGIYSQFQGLAGFDATTVKTVTVQIESERPLNGGSVLRQSSFTIDTASGGYLGGTFTPIELLAGTTYFIDYLNIQNVGINLGGWANDSHGNPQPSGGATVNLGGSYSDVGTDTTFSTVNAAYSTNGDINVANGEPILFFTGTAVPEPTAVTLLLGGLFGLLRRGSRYYR